MPSLERCSSVRDCGVVDFRLPSRGPLDLAVEPITNAMHGMQGTRAIAERLADQRDRAIEHARG
jgi:hypothetical protein